jgi:photosystem II stability/assembly factor-like uncharacterized protein
VRSLVTKTLRVLCALGLVAASAAPASALWGKMASFERVRAPSLERQVILCRSTFLDDGRHGWVAGTTAVRPRTVVILRTTDGADSWERFDTDIGASSVADLEFVDANNGWMVTYTDRRLLRTTDGGENWREEEVLGGWEVTQIVDVEMLSATHGYAAGSSEGNAALFEYMRRGPRYWWVPHLVGYAGRFETLAVHSSDWLWIFSPPMRRTDYHAWRRVGSTELIPFPALDNMTCCFFYDHDLGWLGGFNGEIWRTDDGGAHWEGQDPGVRPRADLRSIRGIHFTSPTEGRALGLNGHILGTSNGGGEWRTIEYLRVSCVDLDYFGGEYLVTGTAGLYRDAPLRLRYETLTPRGGGD